MGRVLVACLIAACLAGPAGWWITHGVPSADPGASATAAARRPPVQRDVASARPGPRDPAAARPARRRGARPRATPRPAIARRALVRARPYALGLLALAAGVVGSRVHARRRRRPLRYRVELPRADRPSPERAAAMVESLHRILQRERGLVRLLRGQDHMALEWHVLASGQLALAMVVPQALAADADAALSACWHNARLGHAFAPPPLPWETPVTWCERMVRLRKARSGVLRAAGADEGGEGAELVERAMAAAVARGGPVGVQLRLAPAPRLVEAMVRRRLRARERAAERARRAAVGAHPGL